MKVFYYLIFREIIYIRRLLLCQNDIKFLEKKHKDTISKSRRKLREIIKSNKWQGFLTLTIDEKKMDRYDIELQLKELKDWLDDLKKRGNPELKYLILPDLHMKKNYGQVVVDENGNYASHFHCLIKNVKNIDKLLLELKDENNINYVDKKTDKFILLLNFMIDLDSHILHIVIIILMDFAFILLIILMLIMIFIDEQKNAII